MKKLFEIDFLQFSVASSSEGGVYAPKFSMSIPSKTSNIGSKDFDEAKKIAAAKVNFRKKFLFFSEN